VRAAGRDVHLVLIDSAEPVLGRQAFLGARSPIRVMTR
jgi:hypothetical protein